MPSALLLKNFSNSIETPIGIYTSEYDIIAP
nr:MAG TPA: hypothetical protein [Caudoviricetes sp.]DAS13685.1 MAG TPA: hypothetical protein [Caudoviricetes sp.]DAW74241.1 MAG TPA: hypothetical protein [Caudoviricetes sp.]